MATKEEEFKQRFVEVMQDLQQNGKDDPEAMWLIGSLACELMDKVGAKDWPEFKQTMSPQTYDKLLADFQNEGNRQYREGDHKKAYAIQVLGMSLVASTQKDPQIKAGDELLDGVVDMTVGLYRKNRAPKTGPN